MNVRLLFCLSLLVACDGDIPATTTNNPIPTDVLNDPSGDADNDGLTNAQELDGWTIQVNASGYPGAGLDITVVSDPTTPDSDGDGLDDSEEFAGRTHPQSVDSDGDGLDDLAELRRWGTNPTAADTDGDAVPPEGLGFEGAPLRQLFDGSELMLVDGQPGPDATSPLLQDTDGDGFSDYEERTLSSRDPGIAEIPDLRVTLTPGTSLDLGLDVTYMGAETESVSHTATLGVSTSEEIVSSTIATAAAASEASARIRTTVGFTAGCCLNVLDVSLDIEEEFRSRTTIEALGSTTLDVASSRESSATHSNFVERSTSTAHTVDGARVQASLNVHNPGSRTYTVQNLSVVLYFRDAGQLKPLAVLTGSSDITLAPGETIGNLLLADNSANAQRVQEMMRAPNRVFVSPASYDLVDVTQTPVAFQQEVIQERTASVALRHPERVERFNVAVNVDRDENGEFAGMDVRDVFAKLGIGASDNMESNPLTGIDEVQIVIDGLGAVRHTSAEDPLVGLDAGGYPVSGGPGPRHFAEQWVGLILREGGDPELASMLDARLFPGDAIEIIRGVDRDRDGLADVEELLVGSSDGTVDSDADAFGSDGLSDFFEVNEPWTVAVQGRSAYTVYGNPAAKDYDNDGLHDGEELVLGLDPLLADTDGDGWSDASELNGGQDPLFTDPSFDDVIIDCRTVQDADNTWQFEVRAEFPPNVMATLGLRRGPDDTQRPVLPDATEQIETFAFPDTLGPPPTVYLVDHLGLEQVVQCPEPLETYARSCLRCPETLPDITCTVNPLNGEMVIDIEDPGADLVSLDVELRSRVSWWTESVDLITVPNTCQTGPGALLSSSPVSLQTDGTDLQGTLDLGMSPRWSSSEHGLPIQGQSGDLLGIGWLAAGGIDTVGLYVSPIVGGPLDVLGDAHCLTEAGGERNLAPHDFDVELEVEARDVDGNVDVAICSFELPEPRTCLAIKQANPSAPNGTYTIDLDGPGPASPRLVYCDMDSDGGGWTLVRWTPPGPTWGPFTDDLRGLDQIGVPESTWPPVGTAWTFPFHDMPYASTMFVSGREALHWSEAETAYYECGVVPCTENWRCAIGKSYMHVENTNPDFRNAEVQFSSGPDMVLPGDRVSVLRRTGNPEDPWVGCRGLHTGEHAFRNGVFMMYGEASAPVNTAALNLQGGMAVFVR